MGKITVDYTKEERIRVLRLSISDRLSKIAEYASMFKSSNPLFVIDDIVASALMAQSETKELMELDPALVKERDEIRRITHHVNVAPEGE